ncbi:MAG: hypothetical protein FJ027_10800 [Candidatus Rokubacteria bacterium]|nr:hypothetical protein [Candidatus Rokubacteria bacterium]
MAEQQQQPPGQGQDKGGARRGPERKRESADEVSRVAGQLASLGAETVGTWTELNQRVGQDVMRMSSSAAEEAARAVSEIQQASLAAWRDAQGAAFRWQTLWPEAFRDPVRWYQHAFEHAVGTMQDAIDLHRRNAETAMRAFDRLQHQSEEAAKTLEDTFRQGASKIRDIQSRTETLRVA